VGRIAALGWLVVLLTAASAPTPEAPLVNDWWPLRVGTVWEFDTRTDTETKYPNLPVAEHLRGHTERRVTHLRHDFAGVGGVLELSETLRHAPANGGEENEWTALYFYTTQADGVYLHAQSELDERLRIYDRPLRLLPADPKLGTKWTVGDLFMEGYQIAVTGEVVGFEAVTTPAGRFEGCAKVRYRGPLKGRIEYEDTAYELKTGSFDRTTWFARGVGPVKLTDTIRAEVKFPQPGTFQHTANYTETLNRFEVRKWGNGCAVTATRRYRPGTPKTQVDSAIRGWGAGGDSFAAASG